MLHRLLDVFASLNSHGVKYLVIGGVAVIVHGVQRETSDLDIAIYPTFENANSLRVALNDAGFFIDPPPSCAKLLENAVTPYTDRDLDRRLDVHTVGLNFAEAWKRRIETTYQGQVVLAVSRADLIATKKAAGRPRDLEDVRLLNGTDFLP